MHTERIANADWLRKLAKKKERQRRLGQWRAVPRVPPKGRVDVCESSMKKQKRNEKRNHHVDKVLFSGHSMPPASESARPIRSTYALGPPAGRPMTWPFRRPTIETRPTGRTAGPSLAGGGFVIAVRQLAKVSDHERRSIVSITIDLEV